MFFDAIHSPFLTPKNVNTVPCNCIQGNQSPEAYSFIFVIMLRCKDLKCFINV